MTCYQRSRRGWGHFSCCWPLPWREQTCHDLVWVSFNQACQLNMLQAVRNPHAAIGEPLWQRLPAWHGLYRTRHTFEVT
jgi:hypothetical protein